MRFTLAKLAEMVGGTVIGSGDVEITSVSGIIEAKPGDITFIANPKYKSYVQECKASAIITSEESLNTDIPLLLCPNPYLAFAKVLAIFNPAKKHQPGIHETFVHGSGFKAGKGCCIMPLVACGVNVTLGKNVTIYPHVYIGDESSVGDGSVIYSNVSIYHRVKIGKNAIIHSGTVIGSDGYGFVFDGSRHQKIPQVGSVEIGDDVEIGAGVTIDRATTGSTVIGNGVKIDNQVQIAHNVKIGDGSLLVAQVGISGSSELGRHVTLAGQVGVAGHVKIGDGVIATARAGITKDIEEGKTVSGVPPIEHSQWLRQMAYINQLPNFINKLRELSNKIEKLEGNLNKENNNDTVVQ